MNSILKPLTALDKSTYDGFHEAVYNLDLEQCEHGHYKLLCPAAPLSQGGAESLIMATDVAASSSELVSNCTSHPLPKKNPKAYKSTGVDGAATKQSFSELKRHLEDEIKLMHEVLKPLSNLDNQVLEDINQTVLYQQPANICDWNNIPSAREAEHEGQACEGNGAGQMCTMAFVKAEDIGKEKDEIAPWDRRGSTDSIEKCLNVKTDTEKTGRTGNHLRGDVAHLSTSSKETSSSQVPAVNNDRVVVIFKMGDVPRDSSDEKCSHRPAAQIDDQTAEYSCNCCFIRPWKYHMHRSPPAGTSTLSESSCSFSTRRLCKAVKELLNQWTPLGRTRFTRLASPEEPAVLEKHSATSAPAGRPAAAVPAACCSSNSSQVDDQMKAVLMKINEVVGSIAR